MKYQPEKQSLEQIGLSKKETEVFVTLLEKGALTATILSREVGRPRTSVLLELESLKKKGFVERIKVGGHFEWVTSSLDHIDTSVSEKYEMFKNTLPSLRGILKTQSAGKKFSIKIFSGSSGLLKAYYRLLELPKGERIYYFEGTQSVKSKVSMRDQSLIKWQNAFRLSGIIIEVLGSSSSLREVHTKKGKEVLQAHKDRLIVAYDLPEQFINFPCDIAILPSTVLIFIPKQDTAIVIDSEELAISLKKIFEGLKTIARKVDSNRVVEELLLS